MNEESLYIILNQYKKEHITEEEAVKLIKDLSNNRSCTWYYPYYPSITYPSYEVTCKNKV